MTTTRRPRPSILAQSIGALLAITACAPLAGAGEIWDGGGANGLWSTNQNWNLDTAPNFANPLQFGGVLQLLSNNNATASIAGLTFNAGAGAFTLTGNAVTLNGGIVINSANSQTVSFAGIALGSAQTFTSAAGGLSVTSNIDLGSNTLTIDGANTTSFSGALSGTGGLLKTGGGTLGLTGTNTYSGTTTINDGVLQALDSASLSPNSTFTVTGTGILDLASNNATIQGLNDGGVGTGRVSNSAATAASLTVGSNGASGSFSGTIEVFGAGALGITKIGSGTQTLSGNNTYTGPTTVNGGTLRAGVATVAGISGAFGNNSTVTMANAAGATLDLAGFDTQIGSITGGGALGGNVTLGTATLTLGADNSSPANYGGLISSTGAPATSVIKIGTGAQAFSHNNTYTGDTLLKAGALFSNVSPGAGTNMAFGTGRLVISGGTQVGSAVDSQTIPNNVSLIGPASSVTIEASTRLQFTGNVDLNAATRTIVGNVHQAEISFNGVISSTGGGGGLTFNTTSLVPPLDGTTPYVAFIFAGASPHTYTGLTTVNSGAYLVFNSAGQKISGDVLIQGNGVVDYLGGSDQISDTSTVTVNSSGSTIVGPSQFQGLELFNRSDTIGALLGTGTVGLGSGTLTVGAGNFGGVITNGAKGTGGQLIKNTPGTLVLSGANVYTGATTVTGGTLEVTGSITSANINVAGATFIAGKSSAISAASIVTVATGGGFEYHATANTPLSVGALTLNSGAGTTIGGSIGSTLNGAQISVTGNVTPTPGAIAVNVFAVPGVATGTPGTYTLLTAGAGSTLNAGTTYTIGNVYNATNFTVSAVGATANTITATIVAATPLSEAYWVGGLPSNPSSWSASSGPRSNWATDTNGTPTPLVPGASTAVFFSANDPAPGSPTDPGSMTLGANMSIASLTVNSPTAPETRAVNLQDDGFKLTLAGTGGINVHAGAGAVTLDPDLILGASQTWTNNSSNLLTVGGRITNGANTLTITGSGNTTLTDVIGNGAGGLIKSGTGVLTLTQNNTYSGDTQLLAGTIFADASPGSSSNTPFGTGRLIIAGGTVLGSHVNDQTIPNNLSFIDPTSAVTIEAHTRLNFTGNADLNGGTRTFTGTVHSSEIAFSGVISNGGVTLNTAGLIAPGDGTMPYVAFVYNGPAGHTYTGLTTVDSGAFLVFTGPSEKLLGDVLIRGNGVVDYLGGSDQISDTARVTVNSSGSTITGSSAPTTFQGFELFNRTETIGSLFGTGTVGLGSGSLTVGAGNFSGVITDGTLGTGGMFTKNTTGTLTLSGANTFTGATSVNNGTLVLDGSVRSQTLFVNFAGTLMGTGTAFHNVRNAGVFSPGHSAGTFTIGGNYLQTGAGTLVIEIGGTKTGEHDLVSVGGQAVLDGGLRLVNLGRTRLKVGDKVTFLKAGGGVVGQFERVVNPFSTGTIVTTEVVYHANEVALEAQQGSFQLFATELALMPNQRAIASTLDHVVSAGKQPKLIAFLNDEPLTDLPRDFDLIAPEELGAIYSIGVAQANVQTGNVQRRLGEIRGQVRDGTSAFSAEGLAVSGMIPQDDTRPPAPSDVAPTPDLAAQGPAGTRGKEMRPPTVRHIGTFFTGVGEFAHVGETSNSSGYDLASAGFTLGADGRIGENIAVGINLGYSRGSADLINNGRVTVDGAKLGVYATYFQESFYVDASLQGGYNSYDTRRGALRGSASGSTSGGEVTALIATGYEIQSDALRVGPTASFQDTHLGIGSFRETGSLAPLDYGSQGSDSMRVAIGLKASYDYRFAGVLLRPEVRGAWQHEYGDAAYAVDAGLAGSRFTVQSAEIGRDSLLLGLGVAILWNERTLTYIYYDGEIGRTNYDAHNISGGVRLQF